MTSQNGQMIKQGLKFAIGAALLSGFFWRRGDLLDNYVYPIFGYVSVVIEPATGGAIAAGLARLGGSALGGTIAAILLNSYGIYESGFFVIPPLTYILAALICETYQWQAAYSQATLIGTLIAMRAVGTSRDDIWIYVFSRLVDNWIGITVGIIVTLLFWRQNTRSFLTQNLRQFLTSIPRLFRAIVDRYLGMSPEDKGITELTNIKKTLQTNLITLTKATQEFRSETLVAENWGGILSSQTQLTRRLSEMLAIASQPQPQGLIPQFTNELNQLAQHLEISAVELQDIANNQQSSNFPDISILEQDLKAITVKLDHLRTQKEFDQYTVTEILSFYNFLQQLIALQQEWESLKVKLIHKTQVTPFRGITFPKRRDLTFHRILEIVGVGTIIGLSLGIIRALEFPYADIYEKVVGIIIVAIIATVIQPTKGKAIAIAIAATISLWIAIIFVYLIAKTFGYNPLSSGLLYFLIYVTCSKIGFTPLARIGAILAADTFVKDVTPVFEQALKAAFFAIPVGALLGVLITFIFSHKSVAKVLEVNLGKNFHQMGSLYESLLNSYLEKTPLNPENTKFKETIAQSINQFPALFKLASLELGSSVLGVKQKQIWNFLNTHQQSLLKHLENLEDALQHSLPEPIGERFIKDLKVITEDTVRNFDYIGERLTQDNIIETPQIFKVTANISEMEERLLSIRGETRTYPVLELIGFSSAFRAMKEIASDLDRIDEELRS